MDFPNDKASKIAASGVVSGGFTFGISHLVYMYVKTLDISWLCLALFSTVFATITARLYAWECVPEIKASITTAIKTFQK